MHVPATEEPVGPLVPLEQGELAQVAAIEALVFPEPLDLPALERLWRDPATVYVGFRAGGRLAAYFGFQVFGPTAHVISNATHPDFRRRGLGSRVLREAEPVARQRGARWYLGEVRASNAPQRRILARLGWREVGACPAFFGNGEDAVVVWRCLP
jgi:ribosomal-protein-alanine N-acetyltransferase